MRKVFKKEVSYLNKYCERIKKVFNMEHFQSYENADDNKATLSGFKENPRNHFVFIYIYYSNNEDDNRFVLITHKEDFKNYKEKEFKVKNKNWKEAYLELLNYGIEQKIV